MANVFKYLWTRTKSDWVDFWDFKTVEHREKRAAKVAKFNVKQDRKLIEQAKQRAQIKNEGNNKTYYIMKDKFGGINEMTNDELDFFTRKGLFPKMDYLKRLEVCLGVVTSNEILQKQYTQIQLKKEGKES